MSGTRYRMCSVQGGEVHVSSIVLGESEVHEHLDLEESLHEMTGWHVDRIGIHGEPFPQLFCHRGLRFRRVYVRAFTPMTDTSVAGRHGRPSPAPAARSPQEGGQ